MGDLTILGAQYDFDPSRLSQESKDAMDALICIHRATWDSAIRKLEAGEEWVEAEYELAANIIGLMADGDPDFKRTCFDPVVNIIISSGYVE